MTDDWDDWLEADSRGGRRLAGGRYTPRPEHRVGPFAGGEPDAGDEWASWDEEPAPARPRGGGRGGEADEAEPGGPYGPQALGPLPERRHRRRRESAGAVLLALLAGFFVAGLLDARNIEKDVRGKPLGAARSVELVLLKPMTTLSHALRADRLAAAVADAVGRGEPEHHTLADLTKSTKPLWPRKVTESRPLRLYIAGDSMDQVFGSSLVNLAEATGLVRARNDYHVCSGLSRPDYYDWPQRLIDQIVDYRPDAAVVLFGANDGQDVMYEGKVLKVGSSAWREVYARRVDRAMRILTKNGRRVYWVGNPIMRDIGYRRRVAMMNHIYATVAERHPGVTFISTWALMADDKGSYAEYLKDDGGESVQMRNTDGIHLTRAGGDRMARFVLDAIEKEWGMTTGSSTADSD